MVIAPNSVFKKTYVVDANPIELEVREYLPDKTNKSDLIIYFPAWSGNNSSTIHYLAKKLSEESNTATLVINTTPFQVIPNSLYQQAKAVALFLKEQEGGIKNLIIGGHSEGGIKAINLASLSQNDKGIFLRGLILIAPLGLYKQSGLQLAWNFIKDGYFNTKARINKEDEPRRSKLKEKWDHVKRDVLTTIWQSVKHFKFHFISDLLSQIVEMSSISPRLGDIQCPIDVIAAENDIVSSPTSMHIQELFPHNPHVKLFIEKGIGHILPHWRQDEIVKTALEYLES